MCNQGRMGRLANVVVFVAAISFANPLRADVRTGAMGLWSWLDGLWQGGVATLLGERPAAPAATNRQLKEAICGNPHGCDTTNSAPGPGAQNGQGIGLDPDGKPRP